jgi:cytochrome c oxidase assembly factor CtaG
VDAGLVLLHISAAPPRTVWSWEWRSDVSLVLLTAGIVYIFGWLRLRQTGSVRLASFRRLFAYLGGLLTIAIALMSGIDELQPFLFWVHMVQHELLMVVAAPLILVAWPMPFTIWGLPPSLRQYTGRLLAHDRILRSGLDLLLRPVIAFAISTLTLWIWHLPAAYDAALANNWVHNLEHVSFFGAFILYWWVLIGAPPQPSRLPTNASRGLYLLSGATQIALLGGLITLSDQVLYTHYLTVQQLTGLSALQDQQLAGAIMWFPGPLIFGIAAALLMRDEEGREEPYQPVDEHQREASGLESRGQAGAAPAPAQSRDSTRISANA